MPVAVELFFNTGLLLGLILLWPRFLVEHLFSALCVLVLATMYSNPIGFLCMMNSFAMCQNVSAIFTRPRDAVHYRSRIPPLPEPLI